MTTRIKYRLKNPRRIRILKKDGKFVDADKLYPLQGSYLFDYLPPGYTPFHGGESSPREGGLEDALGDGDGGFEGS